MITDPREVLNPAAPYQNHRVFLEIVAYAGNIGGYFCAVGKPDTGDLAEGRIGLFGSNRHNTGANTPFLRTRLKSWGLRVRGNLLPPETNQLINSRHELKTPYKIENTPPGPGFVSPHRQGQ
jgi:hypothetical protein